MINNYNKLIRDKVPAIIKKDGREPTVRKLNDNEYVIELFKKAFEEIREAEEAGGNKKELEKEIGDVYEVIDAIISYYNLDINEIKRLQEKRKKERGSFLKRVFLESVK